MTNTAMGPHPSTKYRQKESESEKSGGTPAGALRRILVPRRRVRRAVGGDGSAHQRTALSMGRAGC